MSLCPYLNCYCSVVITTVTCNTFIGPVFGLRELIELIFFLWSGLLVVLVLNMFM